MMYRVEFTKRAVMDLKKLDKQTAALILGRIRKNLDACENPIRHGKEPAATENGERHYRIGDYRLLAEVKDNVVTVLKINVGLRLNPFHKA